jgi:glycosyltransferase involved in cell wall biosynthesis
MEVYILHYHLNPGGVTRIVQSQIQAVQEYLPGYNISLILGHCSEPEIYEQKGIKVYINEKLNYLNFSPYSKEYLFSLYKQILQYLVDIVPEDAIIHTHNINLGKNPVLSYAIYSLAKKGIHILNHIHDFVEDRPENMDFMQRIIERGFDEPLREIMYPAFSNVTYAVLNSSDLSRLHHFNIEKNCTSLLPNPVFFRKGIDKKIENRINIRQNICAKLDINPGKKIVTYPVRAIRRKNIGEYILLATILKSDSSWLVTQPPKNPVEIEFYDKWKDFCLENGIRIFFEAGQKVDFEELIIASDYCFTTSIMEGFGMVFMEPWLLGTPIVGRDISYVTKDLKQYGMKFPLLYQNLYIHHDGTRIDFKDLEISGQMKTINKCLVSEEYADSIFRENKYLENIFNTIPDTLINKNQIVIKENFSLQKFAERLHGIYKRDY